MYARFPRVNPAFCRNSRMSCYPFYTFNMKTLHYCFYLLFIECKRTTFAVFHANAAGIASASGDVWSNPDVERITPSPKAGSVIPPAMLKWRTARIKGALPAEVWSYLTSVMWPLNCLVLLAIKVSQSSVQNTRRKSLHPKGNKEEKQWLICTVLIKQ